MLDGVPLVLGPLKIEFGEDCAISGRTTLTGRAASTLPPCLVVGSNSEIGPGTGISVGTRVVIGDGVRIAEQCFLAGFPGHPLDPVARAAGGPDTADQVGDIIIEDGVRLGMNVVVLANVRIGRGTVVRTASVVTRDLPPGVVAAGRPARVLARRPGMAVA